MSSVDFILSCETERDLRELAARYAGACDRCDEAAIRDLFSSDARVSLRLTPDAAPAVLEGRDAIAGIPRALTKYARTFHVLGQSTYADGDAPNEATGEVYCVAHHISDIAVPDDLVMYVRYHDDYRHDGSRWWITQRTVFVDFRTRLAAVSDVWPARLPGFE